MKQRIAMIGDSHSQILFPNLRSMFEDNGHSVVYQVSRAGWGVKSFLEAPDILSALVESNPTTIIVSLGGNNHTMDSGYGEQVKRFLSILGRKTIFWIAPFFSTRPDVQERHEWTDNWLKKHLPSRVRYIRTMDMVQHGHRDQVHFTPAIYRDISQNIFEQIKLPISLPPVLYRHRKAYLYTALGIGFALTLWGIYGYTVQRN